MLRRSPEPKVESSTLSSRTSLRFGFPFRILKEIGVSLADSAFQSVWVMALGIGVNHHSNQNRNQNDGGGTEGKGGNTGWLWF